MSIKAKRLVNPYEERMPEFLQTCVDNTYKIYTQVSLSQICQQENILDWELKKLLYSSSAVDALITNSNYEPCLVVERQLSYHDSPEAKERDRKKAALLSLAGVPLICAREYCGLLRLSSQDEEVVFNLYTGQGRENAELLVRMCCERPAERTAQIASW